MIPQTSNPELRRFYEEARALEPSEGEVAHVLRRAGELRRTGRRRELLVVALVVTALATAFVFPASRDALDSFFAGGSVPGTRAEPGSLPTWLEHAGKLPVAGAPRSVRLLAEQDGQRLFAYRAASSGWACLAFGNDSDTCSDSAQWERLFDGHALLKLASGVGPTADGRVAVFGLARSSVVRVELRDARTVVASAPVTNGGWVIVAEQGAHDSLVGLDRNGHSVEALDARDWTWTFCTRESGCG